MIKIKVLGELILLMFIVYVIGQWLAIPWKIDDINQLLKEIKEELKKRDNINN